MNKIKIAAVVVTYNRLELLKECITALKNQTRNLDEIIVVNNDSTDGTKEWLETQEDLTIITQINSGSAGGQYTGIKTAYEKGFDWIWSFEDELVADKDALKNLLMHVSNEDSAIACLRKNYYSKQINFAEIVKYNRTKIRPNYRYQKVNIHNLKKAKTHIFSATFEGLLINSLAINKVGLPNISYFIWYDDVEYCVRLNNFGSIYLVKNSIVYKNLSASKVNFNSEYIKMIYGLRNYTHLENSIPLLPRFLVLIRYFSIVFYFLQITTFFLRHIGNINYSLVEHLKISVSEVINGYKNKMGKIISLS